MALSDSQARVLGVLAALQSPQTHAEIHARIEALSTNATRDAVNALTFRGLALRSERTPAEWCITPTGRAVAAQSRYADYRRTELPGTCRDGKEIETKENHD